MATTFNTFNYRHIAKSYSAQDLEILSDKCNQIASDLWTLANLDLIRTNGTISENLNKISNEIEEIAKAAWCAGKLQQGERMEVCILSDGTHLYRTI